ncbi:MAG: hypothetical protein NTZ73_02905 [Candidatus Diapherotrites archaeon]|nr:hypothetical protein [Candidatus Diapherotrites archaeon]
MNSKGQFFFPDLMLATSVFIMGLVFFFVASQHIFFQTQELDSRKEIDEAAHASLDALLSMPGSPVNWEHKSIDDVNVFGIVSSRGIIDSVKLEKLREHLNGANYSSAKVKLGLPKYDLQISLVDTNGDYFEEAGAIDANADYKFVYERIVYYNGAQSVLREVVSYEK